MQAVQNHIQQSKYFPYLRTPATVNFLVYPYGNIFSLYHHVRMYMCIS